MQHLEVSGAVRPIYGSLGVKRLMYLGVYLMYLQYRMHYRNLVASYRQNIKNKIRHWVD